MIQIWLCPFWKKALAQQSPPPSQAPAGFQVVQDSSSLLEYARFLREEEKAHREYLERLYATATIVLGSLGTIGIGLITFFQFKTKRDVREAVDAVFRKTVEEEVQSRIEQFRRGMEEFERGIEQFRKDQGVILKEIQQKQEQQQEKLDWSFAILSNVLSLPEKYHLRALARGGEEYTGCASLRDELTRLKLFELISEIEGHKILDMLDGKKFRLESFVKLTPSGTRCIRAINAIEAH